MSTLDHGLRVLTVMALDKEESWGVRQLARRLGISKSIALRTLRRLAEQGFLTQEPHSRRYRAGPTLHSIANALMHKFELRKAALPVLAEGVRAAGETLYLGMRDRDHLICLERIECDDPVRSVLPLDTPLSLHAGAGGKAVLAFLPSEERERLLAAGLEAYTENTIVDPTRLEAELETIRRRGYSLSIGERVRGSVGLAAPVLGPAGDVLGAVIAAVPGYRWSPEREGLLSEVVRRSALEISRQLGYTESWERDRSRGRVAVPAAESPTAETLRRT